MAYSFGYERALMARLRTLNPPHVCMNRNVSASSSHSAACYVISVVVVKDNTDFSFVDSAPLYGRNPEWPTQFTPSDGVAGVGPPVAQDHVGYAWITPNCPPRMMWERMKEQVCPFPSLHLHTTDVSVSPIPGPGPITARASGRAGTGTGCRLTVVQR